jgi:catechol 2,3-dioxygenase-like lactoylglutathione lyase family enzyme
MSTVLHHHGLLVADAERAGDFYCSALGAAWLARPIVFDGPGAEQAMGETGVRLKLGILGFDGAGAVELFEFLDNTAPAWAIDPARGRLPHLALQVPDTDAALERIEAAGGRRLWEQVGRWGAARVIYAADLDGNVIELLDRPPEDIAATLHRHFPASRPEAR